MTPKDWTLLVVAAAKGRPLSPVQLQKSLFLLGRNLGVNQLHTEVFYDFRAYDYGPFNQQIYNDAKQLRDEGLIMISPDAGVRYRDYGATPSGLETASTLRATLDSAVTTYLDAVVGAVSTSVQSGLATMCYLPGFETPERECWYINMGAVDRSFFTTQAMVRAASF